VQARAPIADTKLVPSIILLLLLALTPHAGAAASSDVAAPADAEPREIEAVFLTSPPVIDGVLDDAAWQFAPLRLGGWVSYNPLFGEKLAQQSEVWVGYDRQYVYFAFRCLDPEPGKIKSSISRRDNLWNDDWVGVSLDSLGGHQSSYDMFVNPAGIQGDILNSSTAGESSAADWVWDSAGKRGERGYDVEIRVPLKSLRFKSGAEVRMGIIFWRRVSRLGMSASWPSLPPGKSIFTRHAALILHNLKQPLKLELMPNLTYSLSQERETPTTWRRSDSEPDGGITVKYGITSSITLDGTYRPDFSQVESDAYQAEVNRRYPVFYSEKRPFFMEGMGTFELAGTGGDGNMRTAVHTRRIIDPLFGVKLTGTLGKVNFATLSASDEAPGKGDVAPSLAGKSSLFNVARVVYSLGKGSYAGGLLVDTEFGEGHNRAAAGDLSWRIGEHQRWSSTLIGTQTKDPESLSRKSGMAGQVTYAYESKRYESNIQFEHYASGFQMDTAFYNRTGFTGGNAYFARSFYPDQKRQTWFKRFVPFVFTTGGRDLQQGGDELLGLAGLRFHFTRQGYIRVDGGRGHVPWRNGEYPIRMWRLMGGAQLSGWLNLEGNAEFNPRAVYYDPERPFTGRERSLALNASFQPNEKLNQQITAERSTFDRLGGAGRVYAVNIVNSRTTYQFDRHFSVRAIGRYDSSRQRILADFLAGWEFAPGTVAYAGYGELYERRGWDGQAWLAGSGNLLRTRRGLFFKLSYLYRL
jgi:hypothetical protein